MFDNGSAKLCYVDADFRGTSLESLYQKDDAEGKKNEFVRLPPIKGEYYSDCIIYNKPFKLEQCVSRVRCRPDLATYTPQTNENQVYRFVFAREIGFDIAFCNASVETKKSFVTNTSRVEGNTVKCSFFRERFEDFLHLLAEKYEKILIDLSPGMDEYMQCILNICYDMNCQKKMEDYLKKMRNNRIKLKLKVILHVVTTPDTAHLEAAKNYVISTCTDLKLQEKGPDEIKLILNLIKPRPVEETRDQRNMIESIAPNIIIEVKSAIRGRRLKPKLGDDLQDFIPVYNFDSGFTLPSGKTGLYEAAKVLCLQHQPDLRNTDIPANA